MDVKYKGSGPILKFELNHKREGIESVQLFKNFKYVYEETKDIYGECYKQKNGLIGTTLVNFLNVAPMLITILKRYITISKQLIILLYTNDEEIANNLLKDKYLYDTLKKLCYIHLDDYRNMYNELIAKYNITPNENSRISSDDYVAFFLLEALLAIIRDDMINELKKLDNTGAIIAFLKSVFASYSTELENYERNFFNKESLVTLYNSLDNKTDTYCKFLRKYLGILKNKSDYIDRRNDIFYNNFHYYKAIIIFLKSLVYDMNSMLHIKFYDDDIYKLSESNLKMKSFNNEYLINSINDLLFTSLYYIYKDGRKVACCKKCKRYFVTKNSKDEKQCKRITNKNNTYLYT